MIYLLEWPKSKTLTLNAGIDVERQDSSLDVGGV